jgi:hypothetical protein
MEPGSILRCFVKSPWFFVSFVFQKPMLSDSNIHAKLSAESLAKIQNLSF